MSFYSEPQPRSPESGPPERRGAGVARRLARRRRALRRLDILLGLIVGGIWLLVAPGVALAAIVAALVLLAAGVSLLVARARRGHRERPRHSARRRRRRVDGR